MTKGLFKRTSKAWPIGGAKMSALSNKPLKKKGKLGLKQKEKRKSD